MIAVVIVNYRTPELTMRCLDALARERASLPDLRAMVVDGGSADGSAERLREETGGPAYRDWVRFLPLGINGGFGWANNQAILTLAREGSPPEYIYLLNPDAEVQPGAVAALKREMDEHHRCGAAGSQLLDVDGAPAASAFRFPSVGRELVNGAQSETLGRLLGIAPTVVGGDRDVDWVTGASVMFRAEALKDVGLFDDGFFLYFEEVELMHRLRKAGWTVRHVPESRVVHLEGASTGLAGAGPRKAAPRYWYESRRRYFTLAGSRGDALGADLAYLAGTALGRLKQIARPGGRRGMVRAGALLRGNFGRAHLGASFPSWADAPGKPPAWMSRR